MTPAQLDNLPHRVILIGAAGMLGRAWRETLAEKRMPAELLDMPDFDLTSPQSLLALNLDEQTCVINCAAYTDVDGAESHESDAVALNAEAPGCLAERCAKTGAGLIHYSTDYVFDGESQVPYTIDAPIHPLSVYGKTKAEGEQLIRQSGAEHLIIRTSWLYAPWGRNFVLTMMRLLRERDVVSVVNDQTGRPTSAQSLAAASLALWQAGERGTRHVCDGGTCTWHEFACAIAEQMRADTRPEPCSTESFPRPAPRPRHAVLDLSLTERTLGPRRPWTECLTDVIHAVTSAVSSTAPH